MLPFEQKKLSENKVVRIFSDMTPSEEFKWHRDAETRYVKSLNETNWKIQLDNKLPEKINNEYICIPAGIYHRVIKGNGELQVEIIMEKI